MKTRSSVRARQGSSPKKPTQSKAPKKKKKKGTVGSLPKVGFGRGLRESRSTSGKAAASTAPEPTAPKEKEGFDEEKNKEQRANKKAAEKRRVATAAALNSQGWPMPLTTLFAKDLNIASVKGSNKHEVVSQIMAFSDANGKRFETIRSNPAAANLNCPLPGCKFHVSIGYKQHSGTNPKEQR